jgi:hypothetical protein
MYAKTDNTKYTPVNIKQIPIRYSSNPDSWGPHLWYFLHCSAANYPIRPSIEKSNAMKRWIRALPETLPCGDCREHFKEYVKQNNHKLDVVCSSRRNLMKFFIDIHNKVNERNGKPKISYEQAFSMYCF